MSRFGLIGPSYSSQSLNADCQMTKNWYVEQIEQQYGKAAYALYPTPGESLFAAAPGTPQRGGIEINGRAFCVSGTNFCEILANGTVNVIAQVLNDLLPVSFDASPQQVAFCSGGALYVYWLQTTTGGTNPQPAGTFKQISNVNFTLPTTGAQGSPVQVQFCDGFFAVLMRNSQTFYLSALFDASTFVVNGTTTQITVSVFQDNINTIIWNTRRLWVQGGKRSTVYYDSGGPNVFDVDPSGTMENGTVAQFGSVRLDNAVMWLDRDERGAGVVRRGAGYTPQRISNHAIEFALQGYPKISDAVAYSYQDQGHSFAVWNLPTAQKTWVYDVATGMWHERGYWNVNTGLYSQHRSQWHILAFGKHLVGDPTSGNIYQMAIPSAAVGGGWNFATDAGGNPIRRVRRSPHVSLEQEWMFHEELVILAESGLGPQPPLLDGAGNARGPKLTLSWSNDYGHTWSNEYDLDAGQAGQYRQRLRKARLGRARDRVYQISTTDPVPWRLIEGYLKATPGFAPQERVAHQYGKVT